MEIQRVFFRLKQCAVPLLIKSSDGLNKKNPFIRGDIISAVHYFAIKFEKFFSRTDKSNFWMSGHAAKS